MQVSIPEMISKEFARSGNVKLFFRLPGLQGQLRINGLIRHRRTAGDAVCVGVQFGPDIRRAPGSTGLPASQVIRKYIASR